MGKGHVKLAQADANAMVNGTHQTVQRRDVLFQSATRCAMEKGFVIQQLDYACAIVILWMALNIRCIDIHGLQQSAPVKTWTPEHTTKATSLK